MEFKAEKFALQSALKRVVGAVDKRSTHEVLGHVLLTSFLRAAVSLAATDLEVFAETECSAETRKGGVVCVPAEKFLAAVNSIETEWLDVSLDDQLKLRVEGGERIFTIGCLPADQFPGDTSESSDQETFFHFNAGHLPQAIAACGHAMNSGGKPHLVGLHFTVENDGRVTAAATDGHRLSVATRNVVDAIDCACSFTLAAKACAILKNWMRSLEFCLDRNTATFRDGTSTLRVRLLEDDFPAYRRIIPEHEEVVHIETDALADALEACGLFSDQKSKCVDIDVHCNKLTVSALGQEGRAAAFIPCYGDGLRVSCNSKYLVQALKALGGDEVFIKFGDPLRPLVLVPVDHGQWDERLEVVMPIRGSKE